MFPDNLREAAQRYAPAVLNLFGDMNGNPYVGNSGAPLGGTMGPNSNMGAQPAVDPAVRNENRDLLNEQDIAFQLQVDSRLLQRETPGNNYEIFKNSRNFCKLFKNQLDSFVDFEKC